MRRPLPAEEREAAAEQREKEDLVAQQTSATAALEMVELGWLQVGIGLLGAIALIVTLVLTRQSTKAAIKSAEAAVNAIHSDRAWMIAQKVDEYDGTASIDDGGQTIPFSGFAIDWVNLGRTPAIEVIIHSERRVVAPNDDAPLFEEVHPTDNIGTIIGPNMSVGMTPIGVVNEHYDLFHNRRCKIVLFSMATYRDIYGATKTRKTTCCFEIMRNSLSR